MAHRYDHLREKAIRLRTEQHLTLDEITERLALSKTTVYYWIKDMPIPTTAKQTAAQRRRADAHRARHAALREASYQAGLTEAPDFLRDLTFRDFVVLYMAEGSKRSRNRVEIVNSDAQIIKLSQRWIAAYTDHSIGYRLQYHADHDVDELRQYWAGILNINPAIIRILRKSNSGQLARRQFRSQYGLISISASDTYLRARLQGWMDFVKAQW